MNVGQHTSTPIGKVPPTSRSLNFLELQSLDFSLHHSPVKFVEELDTVINIIYEKEKITSDRDKQLEHIRLFILDALKKRLGNNIELDVFGSCANGFATNHSDLDLSLRFLTHVKELEVWSMDRRKPKSTRRFVKDALETIYRTLSSMDGFKDVVAITKTRVPIVKFSSTLFGITQGDISVESRAAHQSAMLVATYCDWLPDNKLQKLGIFLKRWSDACGLAATPSTSHLHSFAYLVMLIHYLQRTDPPCLPVLQEMGKERPEFVRGVDLYFYKGEANPTWSHNKCSVSELLIGFFKFYCTFDFEKEVVQIRQSKPVMRWEKNHWTSYGTIEDPFLPKRNLGEFTRKSLHKRMLVVMEKTLGTLESDDLRRRFTAERNLSANQGIPEKHLPEYMNELFAVCGSVEPERLAKRSNKAKRRGRSKSAKRSIPDTPLYAI